MKQESVDASVPPAYRFSVLSLFTWTVVVALGVGWVLDRSRLTAQLSAQDSEHKEVVDQLHLALSTLGRANELGFISRLHLESEVFNQRLLREQLRTVILLFAIRDQVNGIDKYYSNALEEANDILLPLGCKSAEDFVRIAKEQGYQEEDLLYTYEPRPGELEEFYSFLKQAIELPTSIEGP